MEIGKAVKRPFGDVKILAIGLAISTIAAIGIYAAMTSLLASPLLALLVGILVFLIPEFILTGYMLEVAKATAKKNYKPIPWKDFGGLLKRGFGAMVIGIIYGILILLLGALFLGPAILQLIAGGLGATPDPALFISLGLGLIALLLVAIAIGYFIPAAYVSYAVSGKFKEGFALRIIGKKALSGDYFVAVLIGSIYMVAITLLFSLVFFLFPPLGAGISAFIGRVAFYTLVGEAWAKVRVK